MPWLFGYGSLIWRPGIAFHRKLPGRLKGWRRSFTQKSVDHRGTPSSPGRVLTLRCMDGEWCDGMLFQVDAARWADTLSYLDEREKGGYERTHVIVETSEGQVRAMTYVGPPGNPHDVGHESLRTTLSIMATAVGPSGANRDYVFALDQALSAAGITDQYVATLSAQLRRLLLASASAS